MLVKLGDGCPRIVDVINHYLGLGLQQWTRAMYRGIKHPNCLWFPQCSRKSKGGDDAFRQTLSAENWLSADGLTLYERARDPKVDMALNQYNHLGRITFANLIPDKGYKFMGVFRYVRKQGVFRVYKRVSAVSDSAIW